MIKMTLLTAALAAAAAPASAGELETNTVCEKKVASGSWHECGYAPADGPIVYINPCPMR
jgi:hypothetical protein